MYFVDFWNLPLKMGAIRPKILVGPSPEYCAIASSMKYIGSPTKNSIIKYGTKNVPPPFLNTKYGNLQTFPAKR